MLNRPFGVSPVQHNNANAFISRITKYRIPQADGSQYQLNDTVMQVVGADARGVPNVQKHNGTSALRGVYVGLDIAPEFNTSLSGVNPVPVLNFIPATKSNDYYVYIMDDPDVVVVVQDDGITTGNLVAASANKNCSLTIANPTTAGQASATVILSSSINTTVTLPIKLQGLAQQPVWPGGFTPQFGSFAVWVGHFNQHELAGNQVGV